MNMSDKEQKVGDDMVVSMAYVLEVDGEELDRAEEGDPMLFLQGHGNIIPVPVSHLSEAPLLQHHQIVPTQLAPPGIS